MNQKNSLADQVLVVILDGFGINPTDNKNAVKHASTPNLDKLFETSPYTQIDASGIPVGLPKGAPGNSEVGHMNLGAGRSIRQDLVVINESIQNDSLKSRPEISELLDSAKKNTKRIHLMGLLSDGGVHSHIEHLKAITPLLTQDKEVEVFYHAFMDGRDTARDCGHKYLTEIESLEGLKLASMGGRSFAMDRDRRWEKVELAYNAMLGHGNITSLSPIDYIKKSYESKIYDEFVEPVLFDKSSSINEGDCIFFLNFRPDRAIQLSLSFCLPGFKDFTQKFIPPYFLCMTPYVTDEVELPILFNKEAVVGGLSEHLSSLGLKQYKIAETEKFAHITFFFNGGKKEPFDAEDRCLVPSPKEVATYNEKPEMSAPEVTKNLLSALDNKSYSFFLVNYANSDMVGHTGDFKAAIKAVETLDQQVAKLLKKCEENNIALILTADHGNSDQMAYEDDSPHTSHTASKVPFVIFHNDIINGSKLVEITNNEKSLKDLAPTVLCTLGLKIPSNYTGNTIFSFNG